MSARHVPGPTARHTVRSACAPPASTARSGLYRQALRAAAAGLLAAPLAADPGDPELLSLLTRWHDAPWTSGRPDGHAPLGVMGDHVHKLGEIMLSYRFMRMDMDGNRDGTDRQSVADVFAEGFMVTPTEMTMDMHMFGFMYAWTNDLTFMLMVPYLQLAMEHVTMGGTEFTTRSKGLGDIRLSGLYTFWKSGSHQAHFNAGFSLPTGSIEERDRTPASGGDSVILPYPMQLGSGTLDLLPGVTYLGQAEKWSWGAQGIGTFRIGRNHRNYSLGERLDLTGWVARQLGEVTSASLRLAGSTWGNIDGADPALNPAMISTADPDRRAGARLDVLAGLNLYGNKGWLRGHRIGLEFGVPVFQNLDGPQLETDAVFTIGWQYAR